jgi:hypothetical protein
MNGKFLVALAVLILVSSGASYGQRRRGGVNRVDLELRESLIPKTPAPAPKPVSVHPLTEDTYQNPIIISEDSKVAVVDVDGIKYTLDKLKGEGCADGPTDQMRRKLTEVKIWESILHDGFVYPIRTVAGDGFFREPTTKVSIPNTITAINNGAFSLTKLTEVHIPGSVKKLGNGCFYSSNLRRVVIEEGVEFIDARAFANCKYLEEVVLPNSITEIKHEAFAGCTALKSVVLPDGLTKIYDGMFEGCSALTSVTFPTALTIIKSSAFGSTALKKVILPVGLTTIEKRAFAGAKIEELYIPSTVTMLEWLSFENCMNLKKITMPNSLKDDVQMLFSAFQCDTYYMFNMSPDPEKWTIFTWID